MAQVRNSLAQAKATTNSGLTVYSTDTGEIKLSPQTVQKYLVNGTGNVTEQETMMFLALCKAQKLNPFIKEAYLVKYGDRQPATIIVSKDVLLKRAEQNPLYDGKKAGVIVVDNETGDVIYREGEFYLKQQEMLVGGWCEVYRKDKKHAERSEVLIDEYMGRKSDGTPNSNWATRPATMIRKVAVAHALREAFTREFQGMYVSDEMSQLDHTSAESFESQQVPQEVTDTFVTPTPQQETLVLEATQNEESDVF